MTHIVEIKLSSLLKKKLTKHIKYLTPFWQLFDLRPFTRVPRA